MKKRLILIGVCAFLLNFSTVFSAVLQPMAAPESGFEYEDLLPGYGATAQIGKVVVIHVTGWLDQKGKKGIKFISTLDRGKPMSFRLGTEYVMKALNEGVRGMKVGGKRRLMVPANLGYGAIGTGNVVPPNADLILEVELIDVD